MLISDLENLILKYRNKGYDLWDLREVRSGKEATIYTVASHQGKLALKVYKDPALRRFQKDHEYLEGKFYRNPSVRRAVQNRTKMGKEILYRSWVRREFFILKKLGRKQANVPKVYEWVANTVLMEFIGEDFPAPQLKEVELSADQANKALDVILKNIELFLQCGVVHSDLSEYNILWWKQQPYIIDLPQSIDIRNNPNKNMLLKRDLDNLINYFQKFISIDIKSIYVRFGVSNDTV